MSTVLITGTNRGIGLGLVRSYAADGWDVIACCRNPDSADDLNEIAKLTGGRVHVERLDLADHDIINALAEKYACHSIDVLINNAAVVGPRDPNLEQIYRQKFGTIDYEAWIDVFRINTMGPLRVMEAFADNVASGDEKKIIAISSSMSSNGENLSPVYLYSSCKAALNRVVTMTAKSLEDKGIIVVAFCPGHVRTDLGGDQAAVSVDESVSGMRSLIANLTMDKTGTFTRFDGEAVPW